MKTDKIAYDRALGGGPLEGNKFVRVVYIDEAGTSAVDGRHLVVGGVIVHGDHQLTNIRKGLQEIYDRHIPPEDHAKLTLHAAHIFNGSNYFDKKRKPKWADVGKRYAILTDLANLVEKQRLWVTCGILEKDIYTPELLETKNDKEYLRVTVALAYTACMVEVDQWFKINAKAENCMVIAEDNQDTRNYVKEMHRLHQSRDYAERVLGEEARDAFPYQHIQEDPGFQEKRPAHPLILADFTAFVWKRALAGDPDVAAFYLPWKDRSAHWTAKPRKKKSR